MQKKRTVLDRSDDVYALDNMKKKEKKMLGIA